MVWTIRCLFRSRPDVVNVHFINAYAVYFALLRSFFGYRLVLSAHGSDLLSPYNTIDRVLLPYLLRRADAVSVISRALHKEAVRIAPSVASKVHLIPNGVDLEFWRPPDGRSLSTGAGSKELVVSVGRLAHVKGHDVLIRAFASVVSQRPAAQLVIVGEGDRRAWLERIVAELGMEDHVRLVGALEPDAVRAYLWHASVFVLPSRSEGMGLALLEAMATGTPSVAAAVGGVPEVAEGGAALLVPAEDVSALALVLVELLSSEETRASLAAVGRRRAARYSWGDCVVAFERVYVGADPAADVAAPPQLSGRTVQPAYEDVGGSM
jgi:glycosyltransferase involved in cell wall biosynthesis